jgi:SAM-dependent methyltransferase
MQTTFTREQRKKINDGIRQKYVKVSVSPEGLFKFPTGRAGLEALNYDPDVVSSLPEDAVASYCGVGNPFTLGPIHAGEAVLDIGCGGGMDTFAAAIMVGPKGKAVGIELVPEMLARARKNLGETRLKNVSFQEASAEDLPFPNEGFDVVLSNGVFNLIPDKERALAEVFRALKPRGRLMIADQVLVNQIQKDKKTMVDSWFK